MEKIEEVDKDMTPKLIGKTWRKYATEQSKQKSTFGMYECQYCGKEFENMPQSVKCGDTKSCGCLRGEGHGYYTNRFYKTWYSMWYRCNNPKDISYKNYGGRGITVCKEWLDVATFVAWAESTYIDGMGLDRINNDLGYFPENCRWVDRATQIYNRRKPVSSKSGFVGITWNTRANKWRAGISYNHEQIHLGSFDSMQEAVQARDNYIIENNLPHKLSTQY